MAMSAADLAGQDPKLIPVGVPPAGWKGLFSGPELSSTGLAIFCVLAPTACFAVVCPLISSWTTCDSLADYCSVGALVIVIVKKLLSSHDVPLAMMLKESLFKRMFAQNASERVCTRWTQEQNSGQDII
ncbi:hypothetical protein GJ744_004174 [Endocarpon pusillum]|uniref:Uncharacterized protein n=1 Tax=Endocarpon pusillum TaxID=364733 RepID=A0A8H7E9C9_9EURO|nr:hypothetical protein GJ744_004174 [Endocarpon pusillum]